MAKKTKKGNGNPKPTGLTSSVNSSKSVVRSPNAAKRQGQSYSGAATSVPVNSVVPVSPRETLPTLKPNYLSFIKAGVIATPLMPPAKGPRKSSAGTGGTGLNRHGSANLKTPSKFRRSLISSEHFEKKEIPNHIGVLSPVRCKERPTDGRSKGKGGRSRTHIPWCK